MQVVSVLHEQTSFAILIWLGYRMLGVHFRIR